MNGSLLFSFTFLLIFLSYFTTAQNSNSNGLAKLSTTWTNNVNANNSFDFGDDFTLFTEILVRETIGTFAFCGFVCNLKCTSFYFAIFLAVDVWNGRMDESDVIWSANRDQPVGKGATLNLTAAGELVLLDEYGTKVWSSNTSGKSVVGMNLTDVGNLVLFDVDGKVVWQSFDHPTDCLVLGQKLFKGQKLIPSVSSTNWTAQQGMYFLEVTYNGFFAYVGSNPPQPYYSNTLGYATDESKVSSYVTLLNGSLSKFTDDQGYPSQLFQLPKASSVQYMKLMPDGHLKVFEWKRGWNEVADLLKDDLEECGYPLFCGRNALCLAGNQCTCLTSNSGNTEYFRPLNNRNLNMGCFEITPLTCNSIEYQNLIAVGNVKLFNYPNKMVSQDMKSCKQACMNNCSCKAVLFQRDFMHSSQGYCHLYSEIYTMEYIVSSEEDNPNNASTFLKVQNIRSSDSPTSQTPSPSSKRDNRVATVLGSTIGGILILLVAVIGCIKFVIHKRKRNAEMEEDYLDQVSGIPTRFPYEELKVATEDFCKKLGQGGFGSVFEGTLEDGSKIAVKRLEGLVQTKKSFLAEVESIGNIHHVNLVRLRGFCSLKSKLLLVYEFMSNGSLDRWIYHRDPEHILDWECRKKIIVDIAKGLAYLHEDCRQRIIHLDIKPQNILLDNDFNAKIADFGMAKLVDKNQAQVMTNMRGTPGYMAPEWLSSIITEKVDVYSFGIVFLEILCGRKNFDRSKPEESWHLLGVFQNAWEQGKLLDMVDKYSDDMHAHAMEVVEMMNLVSWCLQSDFTRRPSMTWVIKVLEGAMEVEPNLDYNFTDPRLHKTVVEHEIGLTRLLPSLLSGPR